MELKPAEESRPERFEVTGLPAETLEELRSFLPGSERWSKFFSVRVPTTSARALPMVGDYHLEGDMLVFEPSFPLRPGTKYGVVCWIYSTIDGTPVMDLLELTIETAPAPELPLAEVVAVYPSARVLPENQLKFYFHFSAPMSRGEAYRQVRLFKESGEEVEFPFLELGEELWDDSQTRFTMFFDPGRIKRGLKPREEVGPSLVEGESYTLEIDPDWLDARGRPMAKGFRKSFRVGPPDDVQPDEKKWKLAAPRRETTEPLVATFNEPLDHAMLHRVLSVVDAQGKEVAGEINVDEQETRWTFLPKQPWAAGMHQLVVESTLEDLAGNSLAKPFEVDVFRSVQERVKTDFVRLPFEIRGE